MLDQQIQLRETMRKQEQKKVQEMDQTILKRAKAELEEEMKQKQQFRIKTI